MPVVSVPRNKGRGKNICPAIEPGFCLDSKRGKGRIVALCNACRNKEARPKDKQDGMVVFCCGPAGISVSTAGSGVTHAVAEAFSAWMSARPIDIGNAVLRGIFRYRKTGEAVVPENRPGCG